MSNTYYKESVEFQEVFVTVDGSPAWDFDVAIVPSTTRPDDEWSAAYALQGKRGVLVSDLPIGDYGIWVRVTDSPERPVTFAGRVSII